MRGGGCGREKEIHPEISEVGGRFDERSGVEKVESSKHSWLGSGVGGDRFAIERAGRVAENSEAMNPEFHKPEVLAPAGGWECAKAAVENGADAIYFGVGRFNARVRADNFVADDLAEAVSFLVFV